MLVAVTFTLYKYLVFSETPTRIETLNIEIFNSCHAIKFLADLSIHKNIILFK